MTEPRKIELKLDPSLRKGKEPANEFEKLLYPYLDTAYNLLREAAVRATLKSIRDQAASQGVDLPSDDETFAKTAAEGISSYMDLAPDNLQAAATFYETFELLTEQAYSDATEGMNP